MVSLMNTGAEVASLDRPRRNRVWAMSPVPAITATSGW